MNHEERVRWTAAGPQPQEPASFDRATLASAARVRELAAENPPAGLEPWQAAAWWSEQFGALAFHAQVLADAVAPGGAS